MRSKFNLNPSLKFQLSMGHLRVLYMAAPVATKHNAVIKAFYESLLARGKVKKVALVACTRKLLTIMNCIVQNNEPWRTNTEQSA